jgi:hypothetical protein
VYFTIKILNDKGYQETDQLKVYRLALQQCFNFFIQRNNSRGNAVQKAVLTRKVVEVLDFLMGFICTNDEYRSQVGRPENIVIRYVSVASLSSSCI